MNDKPYASDEECQEMREQLIGAGRIVPKGDGADGGGMARRDVDIELPKRRRRINVSDIPEEGTYEVLPIESDEEYDRRRVSYLAMLQSVLRAREELKLEFEDQPSKRRRKK